MTARAAAQGREQLTILRKETDIENVTGSFFEQPYTSVKMKGVGHPKVKLSQLQAQST